MKYGLIGEKLGHSYSKVIHEMLTAHAYELKGIEPHNVDAFMRQGSFQGINVTIPYKQTVIPYLHAIDPAAASIGAVNTIVNKNGKLYGYNTDYHGFCYLLSRHQVDPADKKVLILGSGGTSKTVWQAMHDLKAREIYIVSRTKQEKTKQKTFITYEETAEHRDADIIVNTTPVGMYPDVDHSPLDLSGFDAKTIIDVIYNPLRSTLLLQAEDLGKQAIGGLEMLAAQAVYASELFHDTTYPNDIIDNICRKLKTEKQNIVLIGMPGCGKSTIASLLHDLTGKEVVDIDEYIENQQRREIREIFQSEGEAFFRKLETDAVKEISKRSNLIIATGGGVIKKEENMNALRHQGIVLYIDRPVELLGLNDKRPLSVTVEDNRKLWAERDPLYRRWCDKVIQNHNGLDDVMQAIMEVIYETAGH